MSVDFFLSQKSILSKFPSYFSIFNSFFSFAMIPSLFCMFIVYILNSYKLRSMILIKIFTKTRICKKFLWFIVGSQFLPILLLGRHLLVSSHICIIFRQWCSPLINDRHILLERCFLSFTINRGLFCSLVVICSLEGTFVSFTVNRVLFCSLQGICPLPGISLIAGIWSIPVSLLLLIE